MKEPFRVSGCIELGFLARILDRLSLQPSTEPIDAGDRLRMTIPVGSATAEVWRLAYRPTAPAPTAGEPGWIVVKFPGNAGRAEHAGPQPLEYWGGPTGEIWAVNHLGYGGSSGAASLQNFASTCDAVWAQIRARYPNQPVLVCGSSLGCLSALYLAARRPVAGLLLRNAFDLGALIRGRWRYNWWNLGTARWVAATIPTELEAIANARRCRCPGLFVRSEADQLTPAPFQVSVREAYGGPHREFVIRGAGHHDSVDESQFPAYAASLDWLGDQVRQGP